MGPKWPIGGIMKRKFDTKAIVVTGLLLALEIVLQTIGNYLQIGPANINLSLVPVVLAAVLCGPISGGILGFFNGLMALFSPSTLAIFVPIAPVATVFVCLLKCTLAGVAAGFIFDLMQKNNRLVALVLASAAVPVINTGLFALGSVLFFQDFLNSGVGEQFPNAGAFLIFGVIGFNFLIEVATTMIVSPSLGMILLKREENSNK